MEPNSFPTDKEWSNFLCFRELVFGGIANALQKCGHHKGYEGAIEIHFPNYFDSDGYLIVLYCYVFGPARYYEWSGKTLGDTVSKAFNDVTRWLREDGLI